MRNLVGGIGFLVLLFAAAPSVASAGDTCALELITHGTIHVETTPTGSCVTFVDDLRNVYEIVDTPVYDGEDGLTGTIYADFQGTGTCTTSDAVKICNFDRDYTRRVKGDLVFLNNIECPGYVVETGPLDFKIENCEDFGQDLCVPENLGRHIQATVFVDTGVSICLGLERSTLLEYSFLP